MKATFVLLYVTVLWGFITTADATQNIDPLEYAKKHYKIIVDTDDVFSMCITKADSTNIVVGDRRHGRFCIYSTLNGKKISEFGSKGEGPSEIKGWVRDLHIFENRIYICSPGRLSIYSTKGKFIKDLTVSPAFQEIHPFEESFVVRRNRFNPNKPDSIMEVFTLLDNNFQFKKDLYSFKYNIPKPKDNKKRAQSYYPHRRKGVFYKGKFYIGCTDKGYHFSVYNESGKKTANIDKQFEKINITSKFKQQILNENKKVASKFPELREYYKKTEPVFPKSVPAFLNFFVGNEKIYVLHFPNINDQLWTEVSVLDLTGKTLDQFKVMMSSLSGIIENDASIAFKDGKLYFVVAMEESTRIAEFDLDAAAVRNN